MPSAAHEFLCLAHEFLGSEFVGKVQKFVGKELSTQKLVGKAQKFVGKAILRFLGFRVSGFRVSGSGFWV